MQYFPTFIKETSMIKKSNLVVLVIVILLSTYITNCSDDTEEDSLIGTWVLTSMKVTYMGISTNIDPNVIGLSSWIITVKDDNTYSMSITMNSETTGGDGEWTTSGNQLVFTDMGETLEYDYSLKGDKLELSTEVIYEGTTVPATFVFTRE